MNNNEIVGKSAKLTVLAVVTAIAAVTTGLWMFLGENAASRVPASAVTGPSTTDYSGSAGEAPTAR